MKPFSVYQHLDGTPMTERDKTEVGSAFWNVGKWNNFIKPFLPNDGWELTLIDMGCNMGVFLNEAEKLGFDKIVGVDSNRDAIRKGVKWAEEHNKNYELRFQAMEDCIDDLPVADYTIFANSHYYFKENDWLDHVAKLKEKTRLCIIVTDEKRPREGFASSDIGDIRKYFSDWEEVGFVDKIKAENDPRPRKLHSIMFKSGLKRVPLNTIKNGNDQQRGFLEQLDRGIDPTKTDYYRRLRDYRQRTGSNQQTWTKEQLVDYMIERVNLYEDVKKNGLKAPLYVRPRDDRIVDGNHRHNIEEHRGRRTGIIKET